MSTGKTSAFYVVLIAVAGMAVGMVISARLDLTPSSSAQTVSVPPINSAPLSGPIDATTFRTIAKNNAPAVVNIQTEVRARGRDLSDLGGGEDLLRRFFGGDDPQAPAPRGRNRTPGGRNNQAPVMEGAGTGFIINKSGLILTNNHVIEGAEAIRVSLFGGERLESYTAKVVGHDVLTDSALLQLTEMPAAPLTEMKFGDSDQMQPGDWVMAIGNPFRLGHSVSVGVVSALGRPFGVSGREQNMLQTDAAINPGNSGGPLLNVRGEVVGMNTAIYTDERSSNIGIGFATPINAIRDLLPQLQNGKVVRGVIGVTVSKDHITAETAKTLFGLPNTNGAVILTVVPERAADRAGMEPGDVVVEFAGKPVKDSDSMVSMVVNTKPGTSVPIVVYRDKQRKSLNVTVEELDLEAEQSLASRRRTQPNAPEVVPTPSGFGLTLEPITPELARRLDLPANAGGAIVSDVDRNSPAARGGVQPGDVILAVNRQKVANASQVTRELQKVQNGQVASLLVWRDGNEQFVIMTKR
jgi:serine protease Do